MSETQPRLPDFADPPVIEVALSVQFESLSGFGTPHIGLLWSEFRNEFPRTEEHPPRPSVIERFGVRRAPKTDFRVEAAFPVPQCRFLNDRGTELIQIQQDRFVHNWRKVGQGDVYPRYEFVRRRFEEELGIFHRFLARENLGELIPNQCEVTYVNHIISGTGWERHGELGEILTVWKTRYSDAFLSEPEDIVLRFRYIIPDADGNPRGRLLVSADPAYRTEDDRPIYVLVLTARGSPIGGGAYGALSFLDIGREWIVRGFTSLTSSRMHEIWGRRNAHDPSS
jgi:uncharacterized protein (TIGR04255 family)